MRKLKLMSRKGVTRKLKIGGVALLAGSLTVGVNAVPAGAVSIANAHLMLGVANIQYGTSPAVAPALVLYGVDVDGDGVLEVTACIKHNGQAPNPAAGSYGFAANAITGDPVAINTMNYVASLVENARVGAFFGATAYVADVAEYGAAAAAVMHYIAAMRSLPGETAYPAGVGAPTGPASFGISGAGTPSGRLDDMPITDPVQAADVATKAWEVYNLVNTAPQPFTPKLTLGAHPGTSGGQMSATFTATAANGNPAWGTIKDLVITNATNIQFWRDPAHTVSYPQVVPNEAGFGPAALAEPEQQVYVTFDVTDGTQAVNVSWNMQTSGNSIRYAVPVNPAEQNLIVAGGDIKIPSSANAPAPTVTVSIVKTDTNTGATVPGATVNLERDKDRDGVFEDQLGAQTTPATLTGQALGMYRATETAAPAGYVLPAPPLVQTFDATTDGQTLSFSFADEQVIGGSTTASKTEIVTDSEQDLFDIVTLTGVAPGQTVKIVAELYFDGTIPYPFTADVTGICTAANKVGSITLDVTGPGPHTIGPFKTPIGVQGVSTFLDGITTPGQNVSLHGCGTPAETTIYRKPITAATSASAQTVTTTGDTKITDTVTVTGLNAGETAEITATVHGPFTTAPTSDACTASTKAETFTWTVTGGGTGTDETVSPEFTVKSNTEGFYTWVDGLTAEGGRSWADTCGTPSETFKAILPIEAVTVASVTEPGTDKSVDVYDEVSIVEVLADGTRRPIPADMDATITATLYGLFDATPNADSCVESKALKTFELTVKGPGPHKIGGYNVTAEQAGSLSWVDGVKLSDGRAHVHECGLPGETVSVVSRASGGGTTTKALAKTGGTLIPIAAGGLIIGLVGGGLVALRRRKRN